MIQIGHILSVKNGLAYMEVNRKGACGSACAVCESSACESKSEFITVPNELNAEEGDRVELFVNDHFVLHSIYKVYGIPLIAFLLAIGLGCHGEKRLVYLYFRRLVSGHQLLYSAFGRQEARRSGETENGPYFVNRKSMPRGMDFLCFYGVKRF